MDIILTEELIECLEWMISEDDTQDIPSNGYWIQGLERAKRAVAKAKGNPYEPEEWDHWKAPEDWT